jgi:hypothetical protein
VERHEQPRFCAVGDARRQRRADQEGLRSVRARRHPDHPHAWPTISSGMFPDMGRSHATTAGTPRCWASLESSWSCSHLIVTSGARLDREGRSRGRVLAVPGQSADRGRVLVCVIARSSTTRTDLRRATRRSRCKAVTASVRHPSPAARAIRHSPAPMAAAPMARATRSPAGARRSMVMAAVTAAITRRSMTPTTRRIAVRPAQQ